MKTARTVEQLRDMLRLDRGALAVGFVPTMGALHDGHIALFQAARRGCGLVAASIFVNPRQFDDPGDLAAYPRPEAHDSRIAEMAGVDVLFVPDVDAMYPEGHATVVSVGGPAVEYEGRARPGHFDGVSTVCLKLFNAVQPRAVYLGQKDAQQVAVLRQLVRDLDLDIDLCVVPTVREADGLALSSRNVRLSAEERGRAAAIPRALRAAVAAHREGGGNPIDAARSCLKDLDVEYVDIADFHGEATLVIAVRAGRTRLIDNVPLDHPALAGL